MRIVDRFGFAYRSLHGWGRNVVGLGAHLRFSTFLLVIDHGKRHGAQQPQAMEDKNELLKFGECQNQEVHTPFKCS